MKIQIDRQQLETFCQKYHIRKLSLFGSVLSSDFSETSDIDVLVEFDPSHIPGLFTMARIQRELSPLFLGRQVDLRTPEDLSRYFRQDVIARAAVQYAV